LYNFELNDTLHVTYLDGTKQMYGYKFVVFEDEYEFSIFDLNTNKQLEFATGNVERVNGTIVLKDVELNKGLRPLDANESYSGGYVQDLIILSKDDKICWFDLSCNDLRRYCSVYEIEKDMGL